MGIPRSVRDNSRGESPSVEQVVKDKLCIGCGVCEPACPGQAIRVTMDLDQGLPLARVDTTKCHKCGVCLQVCYGYQVDNKLSLRLSMNQGSSITGSYRKSYIGYASDHLLRHSASSGGVVTSLLRHAFEREIIDGAIVTRMKAGEFPRPEAVIANNIDELLSATGSKYCPVSLGRCLRSLKNGRRYAVVGLPCHIYGVRKLTESNTKIRNCVSLYVGILCGGAPSLLGTLYLLKRHHLTKCVITRMEYRGGGWPGRLLVQGKTELDGQFELRIPYPEYWGDTYRFFLPRRCTLCNDGFNEFSDISCGDAWIHGILKEDKEGTSLIIARTEMGEKLIREMSEKGDIQIRPVDYSIVKQSQKDLIQFKNISIQARMKISRGLKRKTPLLKPNLASQAGFINYVSVIDLLIGNVLANQKNLWHVFKLYLFVHGTLSRAHLLERDPFLETGATTRKPKRTSLFHGVRS